MPFSLQFEKAKTAARDIARLSPPQKDDLLRRIADLLESSAGEILQENAKDIAVSQDNKLLDRLRLDESRVRAIAADVRRVAGLPHQLGDVLEERQMPNGMRISRVRVPLGVIGMIYESRPNVTVDAATLALKSGNAVILKGGKEALNTNRVLTKLLRDALQLADITPEAIQFLDTVDRAATLSLLKARGYVDVVIPRGGKALIDFTLQNASVPVIETGASVVHTYVDVAADLQQAASIILNEKTRRPAVCNAVDTVLIHQDILTDFIPLLAAAFLSAAETRAIPLIKIHADAQALQLLQQADYAAVVPLSEDDLDTEWLDYVLSIQVVSDMDDALRLIRKHSLGHSESICSRNPAAVTRFLSEVDSACVFANVSTAFADGGEFGMGAEIGISTQKLHVRGPFALEGLTTYKWLIQGNGQIRS